MQNPFFTGVGGVLSADIAVPEHDRERAFYASILTTGPAPLWQDDLLNNQGTPIIGLGARSPELEALPLQWMPHFQVADVAASVARTVELGGTELMHSKDAAGNSQWGVLLDPAGAAFGVIPAVAEDTYDSSGAASAGRIAALTLVAPDVPVAGRFYAEVIGWSIANEATDTHCAMIAPNGMAAAEIAAATDNTRAIGSAWLLSLPVGDVAASLEHVRSNGGAVLGEIVSAGHSVVRDPVGVHLALSGN